MGAWIFQGNPKRFDIDTYLTQAWSRPSREILWTVKPKPPIQRADRAFLWRADGRVRFSGGLVGIGRVLSEPLFISDDAPELWAPDIESPEAPDWRVRIKLEQLRMTPSDGMLQRLDLEHDEMLHTLRILHFRAVMVSPVTSTEERELLLRWDAAS